MNLGLLRSAVYDQIGLDASDGLVTPTVVNTRLNRAIHAYEAEGAWPWLQTEETFNTVAGTDTYVPGAHASAGVIWSRTESLILMEDGSIIEWQSPMGLEDRWNISQIGVPEEFTLVNDTLILRPIPDGPHPLKHRFIRTENDMVSDTDTPILPAMYHEILVEYAAYLCFRRSRETERMQEAQQAYLGWVKKMRSRALRRADLPGKPRIRPYGWL